MTSAPMSAGLPTRFSPATNPATPAENPQNAATAKKASRIVRDDHRAEARSCRAAAPELYSRRPCDRCEGVSEFSLVTMALPNGSSLDVMM